MGDLQRKVYIFTNLTGEQAGIEVCSFVEYYRFFSYFTHLVENFNFMSELFNKTPKTELKFLISTLRSSNV